MVMAPSNMQTVGFAVVGEVAVGVNCVINLCGNRCPLGGGIIGGFKG